jgi:CheY-like chemotaxis protein
MADMTASTAEARVLVIDDEPIIAKTLAIVFSNAGYETWAVESAEAAFALLIAEKWIPQLVLIDVHLPA